jgi:hypothetical protein
MRERSSPGLRTSSTDKISPIDLVYKEIES